jgi:hypothetical protein
VGAEILYGSQCLISKSVIKKTRSLGGEIDKRPLIIVKLTCHASANNSAVIQTTSFSAAFLGLADDEIAKLWKGIFTHDHFDGQRDWKYPECDRKSALTRLARLKGRPVLVCGKEADYIKEHLDLARFTFLDVPTEKIFNIPEGKVIHSHTDLWMHRDSEYRKKARAWLTGLLEEKVNR